MAEAEKILRYTLTMNDQEVDVVMTALRKFAVDPNNDAPDQVVAETVLSALERL